MGWSGIGVGGQGVGTQSRLACRCAGRCKMGGVTGLGGPDAACLRARVPAASGWCCAPSLSRSLFAGLITKAGPACSPLQEHALGCCDEEEQGLHTPHRSLAGCSLARRPAAGEGLQRRAPSARSTAGERGERGHFGSRLPPLLHMTRSAVLALSAPAVQSPVWDLASACC